MWSINKIQTRTIAIGMSGSSEKRKKQRFSFPFWGYSAVIQWRAGVNDAKRHTERDWMEKQKCIQVCLWIGTLICILQMCLSVCIQYLHVGSRKSSRFRGNDRTCKKKVKKKHMRAYKERKVYDRNKTSMHCKQVGTLRKKRVGIHIVPVNISELHAF